MIKKNNYKFRIKKIFDFRSKSLSRDLSASLLLMSILVQGILLGFFYSRQSRFHFQEFNNKIDDNAAKIGEILAAPLWNFDGVQINRICSAFLQNELIEDIRVTDSNDVTLFESASGEPDKHNSIRYVNIIYHNEVIGSACLFFSTAAATAGLQSLKYANIYILAGSLIGIFISVGLLLRVFIREPINNLTKGIDRVAMGDYDYKFDDIRYQELTNIASQVRKMAAVIKTRQNSLSAINDELQAEIVERKQAERNARESESRRRALIDAIPDMMFQFDRDGTFLDYDGPADALFTAPENFLGKNVLDILPADISKRYVSTIKKVIDNNSVEVFEYDLPIDGRKKYFECRLISVNEAVVLAIVRNITGRVESARERNMLEERLHQAHKMEVIGMLAGGVAHDLNNVLSGIVSYPELLLTEIPPDSPMRRKVAIIQKSGERAAGIVQDLLTLARRGVSVAEVVNLNSIVSEYLRSPEFEKLKHYNDMCEFDVNLSYDILNISGSPVHLSKTVMNLVSNAAESMPGGGRILIETADCYVEKPIQGYDKINVGEYVTLTVSDNGIGIRPQDLERIFEPFYTKKVMGRSGTGLGMAVVWGTVNDHKGYIDVQSKVGEGTTFVIYFPATRDEIAGADGCFSIDECRGNGETVLVVDDVEEQRKIASGILEKLGYNVKSAASGEEAVSYMKADSADLVVLDMIMEPGMDGLETYEKIIEYHPGQKAVICSGFAETDRVRELQRLGGGLYIKKPYSIEKIGIAVKNELARERAAE